MVDDLTLIDLREDDNAGEFGVRVAMDDRMEKEDTLIILSAWSS